MTEELNLKVLFTNFVKFNIRNRKRILIFIIIGFLSVVLYQNFKVPYYQTKAICISGISEYERQDQIDDLSQRTAIDLVNYLQINVLNKDYEAISSLLKIDSSIAAQIKNIEAVQLYQQDKNEKFYALNKFEILLTLYDNEVTKDIELGLINYFEYNRYVASYYKLYKKTCDNLINDINKEIDVLNQIRKETFNNSFTLGSSNTITGKNRKLTNEIITLSHLRQELITNLELLKPLSFVQDFAKVNQKEDDIIIWGILGVVISYLIALIISVIIQIK